MTQRKKQLQRRKDSQYIWKQYPDVGLPGSIDDQSNDLPLEEEFTGVKDINFTKSARQAVAAVGLAGVFLTVDSLDDYVKLAKHLEMKSIAVEQAGRWASDVEFGRQMLNGVNPVIIRRCKSIPPNFLVTNDNGEALLDTRIKPETRNGCESGQVAS